jgi:hypothetical protein
MTVTTDWTVYQQYKSHQCTELNKTNVREDVLLSGVLEASRKELGLSEMAEVSADLRLTLYGDPSSPSAASSLSRLRLRVLWRRLVDDMDRSGFGADDGCREILI